MTRLPAYFGEFGGRFVPEILIPALDQLEAAFCDAQNDPAFQAEFARLLHDYAGRPTPLTRCENITRGTATQLYLKREDLLHGGAHKTNQVIGQGLLAKRMGKYEIIAETGAGQHGVAVAIVGALLGLKCRIYMGAKDIERQSPNVFRMKLLGATVVSVDAGSATLKDACNEALRDWTASYERAHYLLDERPEEPVEGDWLLGAFLLMRRTMLDELGGWDAGFRHYGEDIDLAYRARRAGWEVWQVPAAVVQHDYAAVIDRRFLSQPLKQLGSRSIHVCDGNTVKPATVEDTDYGGLSKPRHRNARSAADGFRRAE